MEVNSNVGLHELVSESFEIDMPVVVATSSVCTPQCMQIIKHLRFQFIFFLPKSEKHYRQK